MVSDIFEWLSHAGNILALAQLVAAFVTAVATWALWRVTRVLAVETATLAKMTSRPFVVCMLESSGASSRALNLVLRNTGNATAFDVTLQLAPHFPKVIVPLPLIGRPPTTRFRCSLRDSSFK